MLTAGSLCRLGDFFEAEQPGVAVKVLLIEPKVAQALGVTEASYPATQMVEALHKSIPIEWQRTDPASYVGIAPSDVDFPRAIEEMRNNIDPILPGAAESIAVGLCDIWRNGIPKSLAEISRSMNEAVMLARVSDGMVTWSEEVGLAFRLASQQMTFPLENEFEIFLQEIFDVRQGTAIGVECLQRWKSSSGEKLNTGLLVSIVSRLRLGAKIDKVTFDALETMISEGALDSYDLVFVNVTVGTLDNSPALEQALLLGPRLASRNLQAVLEVSEGQVVSDHHIASVERLRKAGWAVAIDDFGVGESNFARTATLRPDYVKVDKSILHELQETALVAELHRVVRGLHAKSIFEGVENDQHLAMVVEADGDMVQGWGLGKEFAAMPRSARG